MHIGLVKGLTDRLLSSNTLVTTHVEGDAPPRRAATNEMVIAAELRARNRAIERLFADGLPRYKIVLKLGIDKTKVSGYLRGR